MKMRWSNLAASAAIALTMIPAAVPSVAQDVAGAAAQSVANKKVTLNLENADIRYALKLLFQSAGVNYTLDAGVQGTVTAALTDVSFRTALESVLRSAQSQIPLTYRVENGVYFVAPRHEDSVVQELPPPDVPDRKPTKIAKIQLNYADPQDITQALGGVMLPSRFAELAGGRFGGGMGSGGFGGNGMGNGMGGGMGNGMGSGLGGGSGIGLLGFGSGGSGMFGNGGQNGGGAGVIGNFGTGFGNGNGRGPGR